MQAFLRRATGDISSKSINEELDLSDKDTTEDDGDSDVENNSESCFEFLTYKFSRMSYIAGMQMSAINISNIAAEIQTSYMDTASLE